MSPAKPAGPGTTFAALLRGVNVGGKNKVPMRELCTLFGELGHEDVVSYIQSGNVVFRSAARGEGVVAKKLEQAIQERFGLPVTVLLRKHSELATVAGGNPFLERGGEAAQLHVLFLSASPTPKRIETLDPERSPGDEFAVSGRTIYLYYPNGSGRSKLTLDYFERRLGVAGTMRNWNTLLKLVELTSG